MNKFGALTADQRNRSIDLLRTKVWFEELSRTAGSQTPYWFWKNLDECSGDRSKWERYKRGERVPQKRNGNYAVDAAAKLFPGSDSVFFCPFWDILKFNKQSAAVIIDRLEHLGGDFSVLEQIILRDGFPRYRTNSGPATRQDTFAHLINHCDHDFDTLRAIVFMMAWADVLGNTDYKNNLCELYQELIPNFMLRIDIRHKLEILDAIDNYAQIRTFPTDKVRKDVFLSWREQLPRYKILLTEHYISCFTAQRQCGMLPAEKFSDQVCREVSSMFANLFCEDDLLISISPDLWNPISWELAKLTGEPYANKEAAIESFRLNLRDELCFALGDQKRRKRVENAFAVIFTG